MKIWQNVRVRLIGKWMKTLDLSYVTLIFTVRISKDTFFVSDIKKPLKAYIRSVDKFKLNRHQEGFFHFPSKPRNALL